MWGNKLGTGEKTMFNALAKSGPVMRAPLNSNRLFSNDFPASERISLHKNIPAASLDKMLGNKWQCGSGANLMAILETRATTENGSPLMVPVGQMIRNGRIVPVEVPANIADNPILMIHHLTGMKLCVEELEVLSSFLIDKDSDRMVPVSGGRMQKGVSLIGHVTLPIKGRLPIFEVDDIDCSGQGLRLGIRQAVFDSPRKALNPISIQY